MKSVIVITGASSGFGLMSARAGSRGPLRVREHARNELTARLASWRYDAATMNEIAPGQRKRKPFYFENAEAC
jgi:NADP-dependent 3-hydroxy acid dehydrogenase YdfG